MFPLVLKAIEDTDISGKRQGPILNELHSMVFLFNLLSKHRCIHNQFGFKCNRNLKVLSGPILMGPIQVSMVFTGFHLDLWEKHRQEVKAAYHSVQDSEGATEALFWRRSLPSTTSVVETKAPHLCFMVGAIRAGSFYWGPSATPGGAQEPAFRKPSLCSPKTTWTGPFLFVPLPPRAHYFLVKGASSALCLLFDSLDSKGGGILSLS